MLAYAGLFLIAFCTLVAEITLVRILSVTTWYHLSFFVISTAMLGMTAGATRVYLAPALFDGASRARALWRNAMAFALTLPLSVILLCLIPLDLYRGAMSVLSLFLTTASAALPFYFAGVVISVMLTKSELPIGRLYASDLIGASLGCVCVLVGLRAVDAPSLILLCGGLAGLAAALIARHSGSRGMTVVSVLTCVLLLAGGWMNSLTARGIRPVIVKGHRVEPAFKYLVERWNSFSRIAVYPLTQAPPQYWGGSAKAPQEPIPQYFMNIDGEAATCVRAFASRADIEHLRYDATSVGYYLGRRGRACVIGVGGGRDIQSALLFDQEHVTAVELNPIFVELLQGRFRTFAGIADHPRVTLVTDEARSYLSRSREKFATMQMSLIDTWAATGAGAFSLSENSLYTVEAWRVFLDHLADNGVFMVSRWHSGDDVSEIGRLLSLAVASLFDLGVRDPREHLALVSSGAIATLLVSRPAFSADDLDHLGAAVRELGFQIVAQPGQQPADDMLRRILNSASRAELDATTATATMNFTPPTDESPYFFNMLRLRNLGIAMGRQTGVYKGNSTATLTLLALLVVLATLAAATVVLPLLFRQLRNPGAKRLSPGFWPGAAYFILIGAGFMLAEIALIQRLTVFLSHPIYALSVLLFTLIASTGVGSLASDRLPLTRRPWRYVFPLATAGLIVGLRFLMSAVLPALATESIPLRVVVSVALLFPLGLFLGLFFPTGMRLARERGEESTAWYWALNGVFGVLCSAVAVLVSIYAGISMNFYASAVCYALIVPTLALQCRTQPA